jgi:AraC-like DNA-binding protein
MLRISDEVRTDSFGLAFFSGEPPRMTVAHRHDDLEFNLSDADVVYLVDGRERFLPAGRLAVFWAASPHQMVSDLGGRRTTWLTVPFPLALGWRLPGAFVERMLTGSTMLASGTGPLDLHEKVAHWLGERGTAAAAATELEVQAFVLRVALAADPTAEPAIDFHRSDGGRPPGSSLLAPAAAAMAAWLSTHAHEDVRAADVARVAHMTPSHAMTVFRRQFGTTIGDYLTQCRIARAQHLLLTTAMPVPEVGVAAGFQSQSQFYARFGERCGVPPAAYRRAAGR